MESFKNEPAVSVAFNQKVYISLKKYVQSNESVLNKVTNVVVVSVSVCMGLWMSVWEGFKKIHLDANTPNPPLNEKGPFLL